ncbi:MAG: AAA family ATPase [Phycisphaerales bacterium]|nr:AAA family ATPase [Phycisphaerales bacterium]
MSAAPQLLPPDGVPDWAWERIARREGTRWAIAERDATGAVIGTAYRDGDGGKTFAPGGKRGLIVAWPLESYSGSTAADPVFVCEGASDTAALLGMGFDAVGVPMAGQGGAMLADLLAGRHVVIVADADEPGRRGAGKITAALVRKAESLRTIEPPEGAKDARSAVIAGADRAAFVRLAEEAEPETEGASDAPTAFAPVSASDLIRDYPALRPVVIAGLLREGETMNVVAAPKVGKSWLVHALAVAVVSGRGWLSMRTTKGRVLLIDAELHRETLARRLAAVQQSLGVSDADMTALEVWSVRGQRLTIDDIAAALCDVPKGKYRVIVIDALYRFLPLDGEENANETMMRIYNTLDGIAERTGAAVVVIHHTSKGDQSGRAVTDVGAGGGAQSRATDTHLILRQHEVTGAVVVDAALRSFAPLDSFVIRRSVMEPNWVLAPELDPAELKAPKRRGKDRKPDAETPAREPIRTWTPEDFAADIVGRERSIKDDVIARGVERGLGKGQAESLLKRAIGAGIVHRHQDGPSEPHRFSIDPPATLAKLGEEGRVGASPAPGADAPGGTGGTRATPLPPESPTTHPAQSPPASINDPTGEVVL